MSREWKPGDVGINAVGERFIVSSRGECFWSGDAKGAWSGLSGEPVEVDRALVVIDPEDRQAVELLWRLIDATLDRIASDQWAIDAVQAALREYASPKPPKPDEPQGLGAVVEDEDGNRWMRHEPDPGRGNRNHAWYPAGYVSDGVRVKWDRIAAVRVLSPGVEVDQ